jgi:hypothetical protein
MVMNRGSRPDHDDLVQVLDRDRLDAVGEFLTLAAKYAGAGAVAAEDGDQATVAIRARQTVTATREALYVIATFGEPEALP